MITRDQFLLQLDRLEDTFGEKHFPDQRELMIWNMVKDYSYPFVIGIVDGFIRNAKFAPLPKDFAEAIASETKSSGRKVYKLGEIQPKEMCSCLDCGDSGFIGLSRNPEHEEWARWATGYAPCYCSRGKELVNKATKTDFGPQFHDSWLNSYSVRSAYGGRE